jgi:hypothetical protein
MQEYFTSLEDQKEKEIKILIQDRDYAEKNNFELKDKF